VQWHAHDIHNIVIFFKTSSMPSA